MSRCWCWLGLAKWIKREEENEKSLGDASYDAPMGLRKVTYIVRECDRKHYIGLTSMQQVPPRV